MSPLWTALVTGLVLLTVGVAAWLYTRRPVSSLSDRYRAEPLIAREQLAMLNYLMKVFPGQVVVPNVLLRNLLSVRRATNQQRAEKRLHDQKVAFVVCGEDGRPLFAFDLEQHHPNDAVNKAYQAKVKSRILKTAGVRLLYVKFHTSHMPTPDALREQLNLAALPRPQYNRRATDRGQPNPRQQLESYFSEFDPSHSSSTVKESEVLDMNGLAELDEVLGRLGTRRVRADRHGPDSLPSGHSGFDGGTSEVRGG